MVLASLSSIDRSANGSIGYVLTKEACEEGGYETISLLRLSVGELIVEKTARLIDSLNE